VFVDAIGVVDVTLDIINDESTAIDNEVESFKDVDIELASVAYDDV
jgi:hypothetical protein